MADPKKPQGNRMPPPPGHVGQDQADQIAPLAAPSHTPVGAGEAPGLPMEGIPQSDQADELQRAKDEAEEAQHSLDRIGDSNTDLKVQVAQGKIMVKAIRPGFIYNIRRVPGEPGDVFFIHSMKEWGDWMEMADPRAEKQRKAQLKAQRDKERGV